MNLSQIKSRYIGIQSKLKDIANYGCLFLCLCTIIEEVTGKEADLIGIIQESKAKGWLADDFTVNDSIAILNAFTGKNFKRDVVKVLPTIVNENDFTIEKWYNPKTKGNHFKRRFVDTLENSVTVRIGKIEAYYIYSF